jgi:hypothetical protein
LYNKNTQKNPILLTSPAIDVREKDIPTTLRSIGNRRDHPDWMRNSISAASLNRHETHGETGAIHEHRVADLNGEFPRIPAEGQEDELEAATGFPTRPAPRTLAPHSSVA